MINIVKEYDKERGIYRFSTSLSFNVSREICKEELDDSDLNITNLLVKDMVTHINHSFHNKLKTHNLIDVKYIIRCCINNIELGQKAIDIIDEILNTKIINDEPFVIIE